MLRRRHPLDPRRRGRAAVGWGLFAFLAAVAAQAAGFDARPDLYDAEYAARLALARARLAEAPGRPLLVAVGSSRLVMAFAPERLPPLPAAGGADVVPFNFGHVGAGPIQNLMDVSRMLADGVRPRWLFLELMPAFLCHEGQVFISEHTAARDFPVLHGYMKWRHLYGDYAWRRLALAPQYAGEFVRRVAPGVVPPPVGAAPLLPLGGCTYLKDEISAAERARLTGVARVHLYPYLQNFRVPPEADGATRALLTRLRAEGVQPVLVLMPEGSIIRSWYGPGARAAFDDYCAAVSREFDVPVVDARGWLTDADLYDDHHPLRRGAVEFTRRLGRDVIAPLVATGDTSWAARLDSLHAVKVEE